MLDCDWLGKKNANICVSCTPTWRQETFCPVLAQPWKREVWEVQKEAWLCKTFSLTPVCGGGKVVFFFGNLKSGKTHMQRCPPQRTFIKRFIPCRLFWCFMQCGLVLFNCGPHSVGSVRKHALSPWKSVDIPNPCAYSSLPFTSSLCCFAAQQLFGILRSALTCTLMLHKGSILKSKTETTPPACCRPGLTDVATVSLAVSHYKTYIMSQEIEISLIPLS